MKTHNTYYTSDKELDEFIKQNELKDSSKLLIQVYTSNCTSQFILKLMNFFSINFPQASLIGSTTDGEICNGCVSTHKTVISFTTFEKTTLKTFISNDFEDYFEAGEKLASSIIQNDTKVIISFIDGLLGNGEEYLQAINLTNPNIIVAGGLAGDNAKFEKTYVFTKESIFSNGVVGVSLNSASLFHFTDYSFDWHAIGKTLNITKAKKNRVYEIDNKTAVDTYSYYLGENISKQLPKIGIEFPLIIQKNDLNIARAPISKEEDGSLIFAANLKDGDKIRFGCADFDSILDETQMHIDKLFHEKVETVFIYSCMARRRFMPNEIEFETLPYNSIAPTSGFFTYGEFFSLETDKEILNQSMTVLALSESDINNDIKIILKNKKHRNQTLQALSHLVNVSTKELDIAQKELELLSITDPLTKLYNRRYFSNISNDIFKLAKRYKNSLSVIMIDIDNFKKINDTFGHEVGDKVIIQFAENLKQLQRQSDISCRYGGEEFVILLPKTDIDNAKILAEKIRKRIEEDIVELKDKSTIQFTISIGVSEVNFLQENDTNRALSRADKALYMAKNKGKNQVALYL